MCVEHFTVFRVECGIKPSNYTFDMIRTVLALTSAYLSAGAVVPQVKLCDYPQCPSVSGMGMGTLHLGDSISGIKSPHEINAWIQKALSFGIDLFDLADVRFIFP